MADQNYVVDKDVPIGLDDDIKAALQRELEGPKVRHVPGPLDNFKAAGGTVTAEPLDVMHSVPNTGNKPDVDATGESTSKNTKETETKSSKSGDAVTTK